MLKKPLILVNFKTYPLATGKLALELAKMHANMAQKYNVNIAIAVQAVDLRLISENVNIHVFAQHFDPVGQGAFTGHVTAHVLKDAGAFGTMLNHAEKKMSLEMIKKAVEYAREAGLYTVVCADTTEMGKAVLEFNPDLIAVEPPELIGGDVSVATTKPELISDAVNAIGKGKVLVGAGVKTTEDVKISLQLGASGILVASGVIKAADPEKALYNLVSGLL